mgnify:CR=1 FL=1
MPQRFDAIAVGSCVMDLLCGPVTLDAPIGPGTLHNIDPPRAIPGGISMGVLGRDQYEAELDFDVGKKYQCLGLGTACVTVIPEDVSMVAMARNCARFYSHESCGQCTPCREGGNWLYKVLSRVEAGDGTMKDLDLLLEVAGSMGSMPGTTICGLADGMIIERQ